MKEFTFVIGSDKLKGLRPHHVNPRNGGRLVECYNALPQESGLLGYEPVTTLFDDQYFYDLIPTATWPFPQMEIGIQQSLLAFKTKIYEVDTSVTPWLTSKVIDYGSQSLWGVENSWDIVNFYELIIGANGIKVFWHDPDNDSWKNKSATSTMPLFGTCCNFRGQLVTGNIIGDWYDCDGSFVAWSEIGNFNMLPDKKNTAGYMPMPFKGDIKRVKVLDKAVIVYGTGGIAALFPAETTFGVKQLANYGIMSRTAISGNNHEHVFVDESGWLRKIGNDLKITKLGFREFFEGMVDDEVVVVSDDLENRFYISNGTTNYVLTPSGLGQGYQAITSGLYLQGGMVGNVLVTEEDDNFKITTDIYDMKYRGQKTVELVEVGATAGLNKGTLSIDYRFNKNEVFKTTREVTLNNEGIVKLPCAGIEFRFNVTFASSVDVELNYINVKYKRTDKRSERGPTNVA